jgi:hypothetical protein
MHQDGFCKACECGGYIDQPSQDAGQGDGFVPQYSFPPAGSKGPVIMTNYDEMPLPLSRSVPESTVPSQAAGGWIRHSDQPPQQAQRVLFWATHWDSPWPMSGIYDGQAGWYLGADGCRSKLTGSDIRWRPLPPAPEKPR